MTHIPPGNLSPYWKTPKMLPESTPNTPSDNWGDCGLERVTNIRHLVEHGEKNSHTEKQNQVKLYEFKIL